MAKKTNRGFRTLELFVVVALLVFALSIVFPSLNEARTHSGYVVAQKEMQALHVAIIFAQGESRKTLTQITGTSCSKCQCPTDSSLRNISDTSKCFLRWQNSLDAIVAASEGLSDGLEDAHRDPWGNPYLLNENEGTDQKNFCRPDYISTAGPDGLRDTEDDFIMELSFSTSRCLP